MITAPARAYGQDRPSTVRIHRIPFSIRLEDACRQIRRTARLDRARSRLLNEFQEGRGVVRLTELADITRTCTDPADATALADCFRGHALDGRVTDLTVIEAARLEAPADGEEDGAIAEYFANPCEPNRQRALESCRRVIERTQAVADALHRRGPA